MLIDPTKFTNYDLDDIGLENYVLFVIAVAGKNAITTARNLHGLIGESKPFKFINKVDHLADKMKSQGFGCYNLKAKGFKYIARANLDLKTCTREDLVACPGIGMKSASFFILHTRRDQKIACLDTHILKWLKRRGHDVPKASPQSVKKYLKIEELFLQIAEEKNMAPATLDLQIWNEESGHLTI